MGTPKERRENDATVDIVDKLIEKIATLQVVLIKNRRAILNLKEEKESQLSVLKGLQKELQSLEEVMAEKDLALENAKNECEPLRERLRLMESEMKESGILLINFKEKVCTLEVQLKELDKVIGDDGSKVDIDALATSIEEREILEDIQKRIEALRG